MRGVFLVGETVGGELAPEMIAAARGHVHRAENLFVLNIASGNGQLLGAEAEFPEFASHGIGSELFIVGIDGRLVAAQQGGQLDASPFHGHHAERAVLILAGAEEDFVSADARFLRETDALLRQADAQALRTRSRRIRRDAERETRAAVKERRGR